MQLIGMLDSAFVRRVAITMQVLEIPYEHQSISVFSAYQHFRDINPAVKAPAPGVRRWRAADGLDLDY